MTGIAIALSFIALFWIAYTNFGENDGAADPSWTAANIDTNASSARDVDVADIDGDGDLDIVAATFTNDTIAWYENNCDGNDPLIFDLEGNGVELLDFNAGVHFDVDVDGTLEATGWVGPNDGLLVFDLDKSGQIEDMSEVFSEHFNGLGFSISTYTFICFQFLEYLLFI